MENFFFSDWQGMIRVLVIGISAYIAFVLILRISGKRTLSKMNAFDFVVTIALGSILSSVIVNKTVPLAEGILAFSLLVMLQYIVTWFSVRSKSVNKLVKSSPTLMAYKGVVMEENMFKERIAIDELYAAIRKNRLSSLEEAGAIILETDGSLTVLKQIADPESKVITSIQHDAG